MKGLILLMAMLLIGCGDVLDWCDAWDMRCDGKTAQMCTAEYESWESWQNCGSIGESCYTDSGHCGGYSGLACCD